MQNSDEMNADIQMPARRQYPDPILLMPSAWHTQVANPSVGITMARSIVEISPDPLNGQVWKGGKVKIGENWTQTFAIAKAGIMDLADAAGIAEKTSRDEIMHAHVVRWEWVGKYLRFDGSEGELPGNYLFDARDWIDDTGTGHPALGGEGGRVRGPRFEKLVRKELTELIVEEAEAQNVKLPPYSQMKARKKAIAAFTVTKLTDGKRDELLAIAEELALQSLEELRPFVMQRAETGAILRACKALMGLKSTYTADQLQRGFLIPRAVRNEDALFMMLSPEKREAVAMARLGFDPATALPAPDQSAAGQLGDLPDGEPDEFVPDDDAAIEGTYEETQPVAIPDPPSPAPKTRTDFLLEVSDAWPTVYPNETAAAAGLKHVGYETWGTARTDWRVAWQKLGEHALQLEDAAR